MSQQTHVAHQEKNNSARIKSRTQQTAVVNPAPVLQQTIDAPQVISPADAAALQRTMGNQAVGRLMIQRQMTVGPVNDPYEQEAENVSKQVVDQLHTAQTSAAPPQTAQRQEDGELQMKPMSAISSLQRQEEEALQMKSASAEGGTVSDTLESDIQRAKGGGQPLSDSMSGAMGNAFGADFSGVKIHTDARANTLNRSVNARAFTTGQDIFFRSGEHNPNSRQGQQLLAHELTHVVQQNTGLKQNTTSSSTAPTDGAGQVIRTSSLGGRLQRQETKTTGNVETTSGSAIKPGSEDDEHSRTFKAEIEINTKDTTVIMNSLKLETTGGNTDEQLIDPSDPISQIQAKIIMNMVEAELLTIADKFKLTTGGGNASLQLPSGDNGFKIEAATKFLGVQLKPIPQLTLNLAELAGSSSLEERNSTASATAKTGASVNAPFRAGSVDVVPEVGVEGQVETKSTSTTTPEGAAAEPQPWGTASAKATAGLKLTMPALGQIPLLDCLLGNKPVPSIGATGEVVGNADSNGTQGGAISGGGSASLEGKNAAGRTGTIKIEYKGGITIDKNGNLSPASHGAFILVGTKF